MGRGEWKSRGVAWCIVEDELGESVQQEDGGASSYQCCSAEGVARVGLQAQGMLMQEEVHDRGYLHTSRTHQEWCQPLELVVHAHASSAAQQVQRMLSEGVYIAKLMYL